MRSVTGSLALRHRLLGLLALIVLPSAFAQSIPGIYGGAPPSQLGNYRYVELQGASGNNFIYPLNGILNYVAYYAGSQGNFLPGGEYSIYYLNAAQHVVGSAGAVAYSPNSGYTNGVQVSPPNPGAAGALGIQGTFDYLNSPLAFAPVYLYNSAGTTLIAKGETNGNGFISLYYENTNGVFIPAGSYQLILSLSKAGGANCTDTYSYSKSLTYSPTNTSNPSLSSYYVTGAVTNLGTVQVSFAVQCSRPN